jgi:hypothetical protein
MHGIARRLRRHLRLAPLLSIAAVLALPTAASAAARPLALGFQDFDYTQTHFDRIKASGAGVVKINISWRAVAPTNPPANFNPASPVEPSYDWEPYDSYVRAAVATGLQPLLTVEQAAAYAERDKSGSPGTGNPDPVQFGLFGEAIARRYSGAIPGLPRVRMFEAWNEPNANFFLYPQRAPDGRNASPALYRELVNQFATGVHRVHQDNIVVAGATFPFTINRASGVTIGPYRFLREVLCLSDKLAVVPGCGPPVQLDVLSHHPYTSGGPTHKAGHPDSISLGDMKRLQRLLKTAVRKGRVSSRVPVRFWVTEFGWDTSPADPGGVPLALHARWVSEALYRSWEAGVSLFVWYRLRDGPAAGAVQSGLWFRCETDIACDKPKTRSLQAFRFPFVAFRSRRHVDVWGRVPGGAPRAKVAIERSRGGKWRRVKRLRSDSTGIFRARLRAPRKGSLRARLVSSKEASVPFSLKRVRDRRFNPFGSTG